MTSRKEKNRRRNVDVLDEVEKIADITDIVVNGLKTIKPRTVNQTSLFKAFDSGVPLIVINGFPGTGKTFLSTYLALRELNKPNTRFNQVLFIRSAAPAREIGFLKGDKDEKEEPYKAVFIDTVNKLSTITGAWTKYERCGKVRFATTSFERGKTYDNTLVLVDEAQNMSFEELDMLITRLGKGSRLVVFGDTYQDDLRFNRNDTSGFAQFIDITHSLPSRSMITFGPEDNQRHGLVSDYLREKVKWMTKDAPPARKDLAVRRTTSLEEPPPPPPLQYWPTTPHPEVDEPSEQRLKRLQKMLFRR